MEIRGQIKEEKNTLRRFYITIRHFITILYLAFIFWMDRSLLNCHNAKIQDFDIAKISRLIFIYLTMYMYMGNAHGYWYPRGQRSHISLECTGLMGCAHGNWYPWRSAESYLYEMYMCTGCAHRYWYPWRPAESCLYGMYMCMECAHGYWHPWTLVELGLSGAGVTGLSVSPDVCWELTPVLCKSKM